ncbi:MAG: PTS fructose transporter subunit IIA [Elusimicrobia bacterium HGW-Elusimicrobia-1]|jgi:PTS system nitrogen regulatory IIA component|nr:MAG: PTS fructose transporter subunit IIA [Elusimicrobia bacterium HGW-Elusimicrobia-1]
MKLLDLLDKENIMLDLKSRDKKSAIKEMIKVLADSGKVKNPDTVFQAVYDREKIGSTGIGQNVAIPHGKTSEVKGIVGALGISKKGVEFQSLDGEAVNIIFLLLGPEDVSGEHLKALARVARLFKDKFFREALKHAESVDKISEIIKKEDVY